MSKVLRKNLGSNNSIRLAYATEKNDTKSRSQDKQRLSHLFLTSLVPVRDLKTCVPSATL
jgi:hypothetical protein